MIATDSIIGNIWSYLDYQWINSWNHVLAVATRANHNFQFIYRKMKYLALLYIIQQKHYQKLITL